MTKSFHILFIGNSYTTRNDMSLMLKDLAAANGIDIETEVIASGGASLAAHWKCDAQQRIADRKWDFVVLQDQSTRALRALKSMQTHVRLFAEAANAAGIKPCLHMTWARKNNPDSQAVIAEAYRQLADETGALLVPAGLVWQELRRRRPDIELYEPDESHPTATGSYIAACTFFVALFGNLSKAAVREGIPLSEDELKLIHQICAELARSSG